MAAIDDLQDGKHGEGQRRLGSISSPRPACS
jgi:hypothetical protein